MTINSQNTVFYTIENAIKAYRKLAQKNISHVVNDITLDQIIVLTLIESDDKISQKEIAQLIFKDYASITRMIELLVKKEYLSRSIHHKDRRKFHLTVTTKGLSTLEILKPLILQNRKDALNDVTKDDINRLFKTLNTIIDNCTK